MGTRCGDVDGGLILHLQTALGMSAAAVGELLNKQSGLRGLCGDGDVRAILQRRAAGDARAAAALDVFVLRIREYIGAYAIAALGGAPDFIALSGGIGENSPPVRSLVLADLGALGIDMCGAKNAALAPGTAGDIAAAGARARIFVVPADEELAIAKATLGVLAAA
jgi:acetate kinase